MASQSVSSALNEHLFADLSPILGSDSSCWNYFPGMSSREFAAFALAKALTKKFEDEVEPDVADPPAFLKFLECNQRCASWADTFRALRSDCLAGSFEARYEMDLFNEFSKELVDFISDARTTDLTSWAEIAYHANNGPGACIGGSGSSWFEKFTNSTLTYSTEFLWDLYGSWVNGKWKRSEIENLRDARLGHEQVSYSRLETVPKTVSESRCICIEPSLNVFFQKGLQALMVERLRVVRHLDLTKQQSINGRLAHLGSIDGSFGTIDMSSASDTIALEMLRTALGRPGRSFFNVLAQLRTKNVCLPWGAVIPLHMVSTMGNAFTFPLQTAIFSCVVSAVYKVRGIPLIHSYGSSWRELGNWGVNGDDVVVVSEAYNDVVRLLRVLGFLPNLEKSFNEGPFRESCGQDFYQGHGVRGVYCKTLRTDQDCISLINRLNRWTASTGVPLRNLVRFLQKRIKGRHFKCPPYESDEAGIHVPLALARPVPLRPLKGLKNPERYPDYQGSGWIYECYRFVPTSRLLGESWLENGEELAILMAAAKGEIVGGRLVPRRDDGFHTIRQLSTPNWDVDVGGEPLSRRYTSAWIAACQSNLMGLVSSS